MMDKWMHAGVCAAIAGVMCVLMWLTGADVASSVVAGVGAAMAAGAGKEYGDSCAKGNRWDWLDMAADAVGAAAGAAVVWLLIFM